MHTRYLFDARLSFFARAESSPLLDWPDWLVVQVQVHLQVWLYILLWKLTVEKSQPKTFLLCSTDQTDRSCPLSLRHALSHFQIAHPPSPLLVSLFYQDLPLASRTLNSLCSLPLSKGEQDKDAGDEFCCAWVESLIWMKVKVQVWWKWNDPLAVLGLSWKRKYKSGSESRLSLSLSTRLAIVVLPPPLILPLSAQLTSRFALLSYLRNTIWTGKIQFTGSEKCTWGSLRNTQYKKSFLPRLKHLPYFLSQLQLAHAFLWFLLLQQFEFVCFFS